MSFELCTPGLRGPGSLEELVLFSQWKKMLLISTYIQKPILNVSQKFTAQTKEVKMIYPLICVGVQVAKRV